MENRIVSKKMILAKDLKNFPKSNQQETGVGDPSIHD